MYTNWGMTDGKLEPVEDDPEKTCAKVCVGPSCEDTRWRAAFCNDTVDFICQIDCELQNLEKGYNSNKRAEIIGPIGTMQ